MLRVPVGLGRRSPTDRANSGEYESTVAPNDAHMIPRPGPHDAIGGNTHFRRASRHGYLLS